MSNNNIQQEVSSVKDPLVVGTVGVETTKNLTALTIHEPKTESIAAITVSNLSFSYGRVGVLHNLELSAMQGKVTCLMGRNGVGKTTLMKTIMGTLKPNTGTIRLTGEDVTNWAPYHRAKAGLSIVPQGRQIFTKLTVEENLRIGLEASNPFRAKIPEDIYDTFPVLKELRRRMGGDLSGGQQQQLAFARSLLGNPKVLLLDEPTEGIQPTIIQKVGEVIRSLVKERGISILLVEQFVGFVRDFGDDVKFMDRGRVVLEATATDLTDELVQHHLGVGMSSKPDPESNVP